MKNILKLMLFAFMAVSFAACSDNEEYDADTAVTPYEPLPGRRIAQVKTINTFDGRLYSWEHNFSYDALGRIKEINSNIVHHRAEEFANTVRYYVCNITSKANYYYNGDKFRVEYSISREYPDYPDWNKRESGKDEGILNENGTLAKISSMDMEYSKTQLFRGYVDGGCIYEPQRDGRGNVTGYIKSLQMNDEADSVLFDCSDDFLYTNVKNKTNFDFSGYFGYWGVEQGIYANRVEYYAAYQLAAFGMLGATSNYLPSAMLSRDAKGKIIKDDNGNQKYLYGEWQYDAEGCPVSFVDGSGRRTEMKYVD